MKGDRPRLLLPSEIRDEENRKKMIRVTLFLIVMALIGGFVASRCEGEAHAQYTDPENFKRMQREERATRAVEDIAVTLKEILREMRREKGR